MRHLHNANVVQLFKTTVQRYPEKIALVESSSDGSSNSITFAGLWQKVDQVSSGLTTRGLLPGEHVIIMLPMSIDLYTVLLGVFKLGAVAIFVDPWIGIKQIAAFAAFAEPKAYIGTPKSHCLRLFDRRLRRLTFTVTTGKRLFGFSARYTLTELKKSTGDGRITSVAPWDTALITFTSGSSGIPKGANRTHGFLLAQHRVLCAEFPVSAQAPHMTMFPIFALSNLAQGITTVIPNMDFRQVGKMNPKIIYQQMRVHGVSQCAASPVFFERLLSYIKKQPQPGTRLEKILTGGAPVSTDQLRGWRRILPETAMVVTYGSTEAEPVSHIQVPEILKVPPMHDKQFPGFCMGKPIRSLEVRIIRLCKGPVILEKDQWLKWELPVGEIGELVVSGDHICKNYYRNPEAERENKIMDSHGKVWHRMGDTGYLDLAGNFWLVGRLHTTIYRDQQAVHAQCLEQAVCQIWPQITRAAAVGLPDHDLGEKVVVVLQGKTFPEVEDVRARLHVMGWTIDRVVMTPKNLPLDPRHNSKIGGCQVFS